MNKQQYSALTGLMPQGVFNCRELQKIRPQMGTSHFKNLEINHHYVYRSVQKEIEHA
jgi:hypothetical protein